MSKNKGFTITKFDLYIANKLNKRRIELRYSNKALAEYLKISDAVYSHHEKGRIRFKVEMLYKLGKKLNVPIEYFVEGFEEQSK